MPKDSGRWHRQGPQLIRHQRTERWLDHAGWRLSVPDLRECLEAGGLRDAAGRFAQGDHQREDSLQQPAGPGGLLIPLDGGAFATDASANITSRWEPMFDAALLASSSRRAD